MFLISQVPQLNCYRQLIQACRRGEQELIRDVSVESTYTITIIITSCDCISYTRYLPLFQHSFELHQCHGVQTHRRDGG